MPRPSKRVGTSEFIQLTDDQLRGLDTVREQWLADTLATGPADRAEAECGVAEAYRAVGRRPPRRFVWLDSPLTGVLAASMLSTRRVRGGHLVGYEVTVRPLHMAEYQIRRGAGALAWSRVETEVRNRVAAQAVGWNYLAAREVLARGPHGWAQVWEQVREELRVQARVRAPESMPDLRWGMWEWGTVRHPAGDLALLDFFRTHCRLAEAERLAGLMRVARSAGQWWPLRHAAVLVERPCALHRDPQGRPHREDGPAVTYRDGFEVYAWHGVRVPKEFFETVWDTAAVLAEPNAEIRRCAIERLGWDRFIHGSGMTEVASCPDPGNPPHQLALYDLPDTLADLYDARSRILLCVNGTPEADGTHRRYGLRVPARHTDPVEAAADLYGWSAEDYRRLEIRR